MSPRTILFNSFTSVIKAADPLHNVPPHLPPPPKGRTFVMGAGKAAATMALAVEQHWPTDVPLEGIAITRHGHSVLTKRIQVIEAGHPIPDDHGLAAAQRILPAVQQLSKDDLLLCLFSGGGSSLLSLPVAEISIGELQQITGQLLKSGAKIQEINTVRKHLSQIQGGRLATHCQAPINTLIISDVTGDDPTHIASGPTAPDPSTRDEALAILDDYHITLSQAARNVLQSSKHTETPKPGDPIFDAVENQIIASARTALNAAEQFLKQAGIHTLLLGDTVTGEAREVAKVYAALVKEICRYPENWSLPLALLSGGETTVTIKGNGRGGRNTEFLLSLAIELGNLNSTSQVYALACDTDGIDGSEHNAGAIITPDTLIRARQHDMDAQKMLANNDAYTFFEKLDDLVVTGPTLTNVNDYRVICIFPKNR